MKAPTPHCLRCNLYCCSRCGTLAEYDELHGDLCRDCQREHFGCIECGAVEAEFVADEGRYCLACVTKLALANARGVFGDWRAA